MTIIKNGVHTLAAILYNVHLIKFCQQWYLKAGMCVFYTLIPVYIFNEVELTPGPGIIYFGNLTLLNSIIQGTLDILCHYNT